MREELVPGVELENMEDKFGWERGVGGGVGMMHHDGVPNNMFNGWNN